ncbi:hypothetical protein [Streptomyces sp. NBC_01803]|uniref:hypothetical protein n=1 Tax=Streptomyces sp. NBC_01803 TaxID=2975946 RepID=UPI002DDB32FB|nr:hypothetical protein [Streptomyces sp. NBC_01803]WSA45553.1 hypothetical protein OIE51_15910 [Streptomyces sp. NBC_01803]
MSAEAGREPVPGGRRYRVGKGLLIGGGVVGIGGPVLVLFAVPDGAAKLVLAIGAAPLGVLLALVGLGLMFGVRTRKS